MVVGLYGHGIHEDIAEKVQGREGKERCHKLARNFLILIFLLSVYWHDQRQPSTWFSEITCLHAQAVSIDW